MDEAIQFARTSDGVTVAYRVQGTGGPLVSLGIPCHSSLRLEGAIPAFRRWHERLARGNRLVRLDFRGGGDSERDVESFTADALELDVLAVVDRLALPRFSLFARDGAVPVAIRLASHFPERIEKLVLYNGWINGVTHDIHSRLAAIEPLLSVDWPMFTEIVTRTVLRLPEHDAAITALFLQRCTTPMAYQRVFTTLRQTDVTSLLPLVSSPTLVIHPGRNQISTLAASIDLARGIEGATLVTQSNALLPLRGWEETAQAVDDFLGSTPAPAPSQPPDFGLSNREQEVLGLLSRGKTNLEIADELVISLHTVARHITNILAKTNTSNRTQAALLATRTIESR